MSLQLLTLVTCLMEVKSNPRPASTECKNCITVGQINLPGNACWHDSLLATNRLPFLKGLHLSFMSVFAICLELMMSSDICYLQVNVLLHTTIFSKFMFDSFSENLILSPFKYWIVENDWVFIIQHFSILNVKLCIIWIISTFYMIWFYII